MPERFSIDEYFDEARNREEKPLVRQEQLPILLSSTSVRCTAQRKNAKSTAVKFVPVFGAAALLVLAIFLLPDHADISPQQARQQPEPAVYEMPIAFGEPAMEQQAEKAAIEQEAPSNTPASLGNTSGDEVAVHNTAAFALAKIPIAQRMITLSKAELRPLGISATQEAVSYTGATAPRVADVARQLDISVEQLQSLAEKGNINLDTYLTPVKVTIRTNGIGTKEMNPNEQEVRPVAVPRMAAIYSEGRLVASYWQRSDNELVEALRQKYAHLRDVAPDSSVARLVPVHFTIENKRDAYFKKVDVVLWFEASQEFVEALPEPYRAALQQETKSVVISGIPGEYYMENWRTTTGAVVETSLYPNPVMTAGGSTTLAYTLDSQRRVTITLHDMFGREITSIDAGQREPGSYTASIPLTDRESGVYLVVITTDRNERAVRRLLIQR